MSSRRLAGVLVAMLAPAVLLAIWARERPPRTDREARARLARRRPEPRDSNVVVVTIDTLRADRLGCYGAKAVETPEIDALAREGVLFEHVTATAPLTQPSHVSILTGLLPPHHGVRYNGGFLLAASKTTLAKRLKDAGYVTGAFVGAWVLESSWGLGQGFDRYADWFDFRSSRLLMVDTVEKRGDEVVAGAIAWLRAMQPRKFFLWVHLYDPHFPYDPPEPFRTRYEHAAYDGEVAYADRAVGRLLAFLRENGLLDATLVVLTADHGESLGEHGEATHGEFIYDSTTAIPLVIRTPWRDRGRVSGRVSNVDISPTILDLVGLPPLEPVDGRSLVRAVLNPAAQVGHPVYAESYYRFYRFGLPPLRGLRDGRYQFIDAPQPELYDLEQDPTETRNIYDSDRARGEALRAALEAAAPAGLAPERQRLDPAQAQRLAALGYVGNPEPAPRDDNKTVLRLSGLLHAAREAALQGRLDDAIFSFKALLALKPDHAGALMNLAHLYRARGQLDAAAEGWRHALRLSPRSPQVWYELAALYLDQGRVDEAAATLRAGLAANPGMVVACDRLAVIAFSRGELEEAEPLARRTLELEPERRGARYTLGRILEARGDLAGAESAYREEVRLFPDNAKARLGMADLLSRRGERDEGRAQLRAALEKFPGFGPAYIYLARDEARAGHGERAAELVRQGLAAESPPELAPLVHHVLAEVYQQLGQPSKAQAETADAQRAEARWRLRPPLEL